MQYKDRDVVVGQWYVWALSRQSRSSLQFFTYCQNIIQRVKERISQPLLSVSGFIVNACKAIKQSRQHFHIFNNHHGNTLVHGYRHSGRMCHKPLVVPVITHHSYPERLQFQTCKYHRGKQVRVIKRGQKAMVCSSL